MHTCFICGKIGNLDKHHIIHGHGKRKACETQEALIDICFDCHRLVHMTGDTSLDQTLKLDLQDTYFKKGYTEDNIRKLMGGKLFINPKEKH